MLSEHMPEARQRRAANSSDELTGRLLYVEDNAQIAEITCMMMEDMGLEIVRAASAEEALRVAGEGDLQFDMVLTDVVMPGLSGVQLARRLNQRWPDLPVVLVSGFSEEIAAGYGAQYELLRKPFTRGALLDTLQRHLDGEFYQTA